MRTAFPWLPEMSWQSRTISGQPVYRVRVEDPRGDAAPLIMAITSGWHDRPQRAWDELERIAEVWLSAVLPIASE